MNWLGQWIVMAFVPCFLWGTSNSTEVRLGYFYPAAQTMRDIYHNGGVEFEIEQRIGFAKAWNAWFNFNYFQRDGHSLGLGNKTTVHIYPLSLGFHYHRSICSNVEWYLGLGGSSTWITLHDQSKFVKQHGHKQGLGLVGKSGLIYHFSRQNFLDLFVDYYYTPVSGEHSHHPLVYPKSQDIGGLRTGLGFGFLY